jgi:hypothetical protein
MACMGEIERHSLSGSARARTAPAEPEQLRRAARCGAKTRSGTPCQSPAVTGRRRCRMHGGAPGSGGPKGARNGYYKHGLYTAEAIASRRSLRLHFRVVRALSRSLCLL